MPELLKRALKENAAVGSFNGFVSNKSQELEQEIKELRRSAEENGRIIQKMERKEKELFQEYISTKKVAINKLLLIRSSKLIITILLVIIKKYLESTILDYN